MRIEASKRIALLAAVAAVLSAATNAFGQERPPTVSLKPADSSITDPNLGGWFVFRLAPGESARGKARLTNVADIPVRVKLYFADLIFGDTGTPTIRDTQMTDVGTWGHFLQAEAVIGPRETVDKEFEILVPSSAEPGDHIGVVVAESEPQGGNIRIVPRVATRIYVTIPGDVTKAFEIKSVTTKPDSWFMTSNVLVTVILRNTGRIRLHPIVQVRSTRAEGAEVVLSRSVEKYVTDLKVPWYGGFIKVPIVARTEGGLIRRVNESVFIFPWLLLMILGAGAALAWFVRGWWRSRASRLAGLHADIRRLESLITERPLGAPQAPITMDEDDDIDEEAALLSAYKRVIRTDSLTSLPRIAIALHEIGSRDALKILVEAQPHATGSWVDDISAAIDSYAAKSKDEPPSDIKPKPKARPPASKIRKEPPARSKKSTTPPHKPRGR